MATVNIGKTFVSLAEFRDLIDTFGTEITVLGFGEPGMAKSATLSALAERYGDSWRETGDDYPEDKYRYVYIDCTNEEINDRKMNMPRHDTRSIAAYLSDEFRLDDGKPLIILIDEYSKGPRALQATWSRLMLNRVIGSTRLPAGSRVFATSNHASDGIGDKIEAHSANRLMIVNVRKPNAREFNQYAVGAGISQIIRSWVSANPRCLASYLDGGQDDNEFIFNPLRSGSVSFVSPRSLSKADIVARQYGKMPDHVIEAAIAGVVGMAAAKSMMATFALDKDITPIADVIKNPTGVAVPENPTAQILMMVKGADQVETQDELEAFMQFVERIPSFEVQQVFFSQMVTQTRTIALARSNKKLTKWRLDNYEYIS